MPKRKADPQQQQGIRAAFAKVGETQTKKYPPLETSSRHSTVPDVYVEGELRHKYDDYRKNARVFRGMLMKAAQQRQQARSSACRGGTTPAAGLNSPASADLADFDLAESSAKQEAKVLHWQSCAEYVVQQLSDWAGSQVMLQQHLQEYLLHIILNYDLHPDPMLSVRAYWLLQQNLAAHPPIEAAVLEDGQPQIVRNDLCWHPLRKPEMDKDKDADSKDGKLPTFKEVFGGIEFELLNNLVRNAVHLVTGDRNSSCYTVRPPGSSTPSQGQGLVLLYLVQLLQADALVRLAVFEQHMQSCQELPLEEVKKVRGRAANVLKDSLLHRVLQTDPGWLLSTEDERSRHRLVRDLLVMVASSPDDSPPTSSAGTPAAAVACSSNSSMETPTSADAAAAAAAAVQPVQPQELIGAARQLLLLLLQLYSGLEAAGEYGGSAGHHAARGHIGQNDRWWLDNCMLLAMTGLQKLQPLRVEAVGPVKAAAALQRVLQLLPPVHRVRLIALGVAQAIGNRSYDDPRATANPHINALYEYFTDQGKGNAEFRKGDAVEVMKALAERVEWACREVLGGKEALAIVLSSLVSAAVAGKQLPAAEQQVFKQVALSVLDSVLKDNKAQLANTCASQQGCSEVLLSLGLAMQQLKV